MVSYILLEKNCMKCIHIVTVRFSHANTAAAWVLFSYRTFGSESMLGFSDQARAWSEDLLGGKCLVNTKTLYCGFQLQFRQLREHFKFCHGFVLICMIYITYFPLLPVADCFPIEFLVSCSHDCFYCTLKLLTYLPGSCMCTYFHFEHNRTPSGKKMVTGVQVVTGSQVQSIRCRWRGISSYP